MLIGSCSVECATMPATILNTELACDWRQVGICPTASKWCYLVYLLQLLLLLLS